MARDQLPVGNNVGTLVLIRNRIYLAHQTCNLDGGEVIRTAKGAVDEGKTRVAGDARIETHSIVCDERGVHPVQVRVRLGDVLRVGLAVVVNKTPVRAGLNRMPTLDPGKVVNKIVQGNVGQNSVVQSNRVVQAAQAIEILIVQSGVPQPLPNKGIAKIVDEIVANDPGITGRDSLAVIGADFIRRQAGELRRQFLVVVLQVP